MAVSDAPRYITLKAGLALPVDAMRLMWELEERGFVLTRLADAVLSVQPHERLTRDDYNRIRRWKWHLLAILDYAPESAQ